MHAPVSRMANLVRTSYNRPAMTRFTVNDTPVQYRLPPETPLLWALRDVSNLTGTKYGCGVGLCGACTVLIDGEAARSCQVAIGDIEGAFVTTIEGLSADRSHPVQLAWIAEQAPQCGYCQSGMVLAVAALLRTNPRPAPAEVADAITNICRCGTYPRIGRAIARIAAGEGLAPTAAPGTSLEQAAEAVPALRAPAQVGLATGG
jgi:isoquinoline 1-oxidoreductase alpha subunit